MSPTSYQAAPPRITFRRKRRCRMRGAPSSIIERKFGGAMGEVLAYPRMKMWGGRGS